MRLLPGNVVAHAQEETAVSEDDEAQVEILFRAQGPHSKRSLSLCRRV